MGVVPSGQFSLHVEGDRLQLTIAGVLFGQYRFAFDRHLGVFERDDRTVCALAQITGVELQSTAMGPGLPYTFMLVVAHPDGVEHLYTNENKEAVAELAARIAEHIGVQVTHREQPFQRQAREAIDRILPPGALDTASPVRLPKPVQGAITLWGALGQALAGMMLIFMCGLVLLSAPPQGFLLMIGGVLGVLGLVLLGHAVFRATRTVQSGAFSPDPAGVAPSTDAEEAARFAPATGTSQGTMGLYSLMRRTDLALGVIFLAIGAGVAAAMIPSTIHGGATAPFLVGLLFAAVGGFLTWQSVQKISVWRAIQASPLAVEAVVHEIRQVNRRPPRYALDYRYQAPGWYVSRRPELLAAARGGRPLAPTRRRGDPRQPGSAGAEYVGRPAPDSALDARGALPGRRPKSAESLDGERFSV